MLPFSCCWTKRYLLWSKWEFWFISPQSKLVWSSGCFHLRLQCVVKWNTLGCWFQQLLKLPLCFLLMFFERLSAILMLFFVCLFSRLIESILSGQCWCDVEMTQSCWQPFSFSKLEAVGSVVAKIKMLILLILLIWYIVLYIIYPTLLVV